MENYQKMEKIGEGTIIPPAPASLSSLFSTLSN